MNSLYIAEVTHAGDASSVTVSFKDYSFDLHIDDELADNINGVWGLIFLWSMLHGAEHVYDYESPVDLMNATLEFRKLIRIVK